MKKYTLFCIALFLGLVVPAKVFAQEDGFTVSFTITSESTTTPTTTPPVVATSTSGVAPPQGNGPAIGFGEVTNAGFGPNEISAITVDPDVSSVRISWQTAYDSQSVIYWGRTLQYELGVLTQESFTKNHAVELTGFAPGEVYYFKIESIDKQGRVAHFLNQNFVTDTPAAFTPPANVSNVFLVQDGNAVRLSWQNPGATFDEIRVVRSTRFFPRDIFDGAVVYEGRGSRFTDVGIEAGVTYYYTIFVRGFNGLYSSGALGVIAVGPFSVVTPEGTPAVPDELVIPLPPAARPIDVADLRIVQDGKRILPENGRFSLVSGEPVLIGIDPDKIPEGSRVVVFEFGVGQNLQRVLLSLIPDRSSFQAVISGPPSVHVPFRVILSDSAGKLTTLAEGAFSMVIKKSSAFLEIAPAREFTLLFFSLILIIFVLSRLLRVMLLAAL